jgi:hypothetical protein
MIGTKLYTPLLALSLLAFKCDNFAQSPKATSKTAKPVAVKKIIAPILPAADRTDQYLDYLKGRKIGMLINQTSIIGSKKMPLVDSLLKLGVDIKKIYGPEHGFRVTPVMVPLLITLPMPLPGCLPYPFTASILNPRPKT